MVCGEGAGHGISWTNVQQCKGASKKTLRCFWMSLAYRTRSEILHKLFAGREERCNLSLFRMIRRNKGFISGCFNRAAFEGHHQSFSEWADLRAEHVTRCLTESHAGCLCSWLPVIQWRPQTCGLCRDAQVSAGVSAPELSLEGLMAEWLALICFLSG